MGGVLSWDGAGVVPPQDCSELGALELILESRLLRELLLLRLLLLLLFLLPFTLLILLRLLLLLEALSTSLSPSTTGFEAYSVQLMYA